MPFMLDDKIADILKFHDELTHKLLNEINGYREIVKTIEAMIQRKEKDIQAINDKTTALLKETTQYPEITNSEKAALILITRSDHDNYMNLK